LSEATEVVDIWTSNEFKPFADHCAAEICIHPIHQQQIENYVQLSGLISKTKVDETRRSCRVISVAGIIRTANREVADKRKGVKRVQGGSYGSFFLDFFDEYGKKMDRARKELGKELCDRIVKHITSPKKKVSEIKRDKIVTKFRQRLQQKRKKHKAELPTGFDITARVGGKIFLRILTKKNNLDTHVLAEIKARKIKITKRQEEVLTLAEQRKMIRVHERGLLVTKNPGMELNEKDVMAIVPVSEEVKGLFTLQDEILNKEAGIVALEAE